MNDMDYMALALKEAKKAEIEKEIPIGAVLVYHDMVIASDHNRKESSSDPTAHAEVLVLRKAAEILGTWRLTGSCLYVTIEPCPMCAGALLNARVSRLVYGAPNAQYGAIRSRYEVTSALNHTLEIKEGVLEKECKTIVDHFFNSKRQIET